IWFEHGRCDVTTAASDARRVFVAVDRFRPFELDPKGESGTTRVVMKRGIPIRVVLEPPLKPVEGDDRIFIGYPWRPRCGGAADEDLENESVRTFEVAPGGSATFDIPEPGDWRVIFLCPIHRLDDEVFDQRAACDRTIHVEDRPKAGDE